MITLRARLSLLRCIVLWSRRIKYKLLPWWDRTLRHCGLIRLSYHDGLMSGERYRADQVRKETDELKNSLERIIPKLAAISGYSNPATSGGYRICVDLDDFTIREVFQHGNDQSIIRYVGEYVGHMVTRELFTVNMHRFSEPPFTYPRRTP